MGPILISNKISYTSHKIYHLPIWETKKDDGEDDKKNHRGEYVRK